MNDKNTLAVTAIVLSIMIVGLIYVETSPKQKPPTQQPPGWDQPWDKSIPPKPPQSFSFQDALNSIDEVEIKKDLYYLASQELEGRMTGKRGHIVAADYIKKRCEELGLPTMYHKFTSQDIGRRIQGVNSGPKHENGNDYSYNVYSWIEGNDPNLKNEVIVVGAHLDHIGYGPSMSRSRQIAVHPGADDNASGSCALLQIAEAFSKMKEKNKRTIVFQWYSAEEMGLHGSRFYCKNPVFPKGKTGGRLKDTHIAMINLDMVGYLGKGTYFSGFYEGNSSLDIGKIIDHLNERYSFAKSITSRGSGGSDHANFYNHEVPVAFLHTGGHPHYHTPSDTPDKINYEGIEKVARYAFELTWELDQLEIKPAFNYNTFRVMKLVHDHGNPEAPLFHLHD